MFPTWDNELDDEDWTDEWLDWPKNLLSYINRIRLSDYRLTSDEIIFFNNGFIKIVKLVLVLAGHACEFGE